MFEFFFHHHPAVKMSTTKYSCYSYWIIFYIKEVNLKLNEHELGTE